MVLRLQHYFSTVSALFKADASVCGFSLWKNMVPMPVGQAQFFVFCFDLSLKALLQKIARPSSLPAGFGPAIF